MHEEQNYNKVRETLKTRETLNPFNKLFYQQT